MSEFTHAFWPWFICIVTILSLAAVLWLIRWLSGGKRVEPGQRAETMGHVWDGDLEELNNPLPRWWLQLFYITLIFGAVYLVLYPGVAAFSGVLGWQESRQYEQEIAAAEKEYGPIFRQYLAVPIASLVNDPNAIRVGERLFSTYCTTCHGSDARGVRGFPNLRDNDWLYGGTPEDIEQTIRNGRRGAMPPWAAILGDHGVFDVGEYVRGLSGREVNVVVASKGREIFRQNCAVCHGAEGGGNQQIGAPNLSDNIWLHGGSQQRIQESIANGRNSMMPAHGEFLGEAKVHLLAAYVFGLRLDKDIDD
ncbi:MAG: cytochrome-c oxidase, cbb3-type subunit III [Gammaproteobacteria bacterium]|nr:cytochrome-c oxidase, cbb3-type subunit III [Gammaproteobacteria bacterium]